MATKVELQPWERLREFAQAGDARGLEAYIESLAPSEAVRAIFRLGGEDQERVLTTLTPAEAAGLIDEIPDEHAADMVERLAAADAASILHEMDSADQADVLSDLKEEDAEAILAEMDPKKAEDARKLIRYAPDVAGGLMTTEYLAYPKDAIAIDVLEDLGTRAEDSSKYVTQHVYVVSPSGRLAGVLALRNLALSPRSTPLAELMVPSLFVTAETPLDELDAFFERHPFFGVPVVDERDRLIGVVGRSAIEEALSERAESDLLKTQGIVGGDEIRTMPVLVRSRRRLSWLSVNILLNIIAASVIALYQDTLSAVIALAVFLPIVSDMSGCTGNQAVAVSMRELALGIVKPFEVLRVWFQEISVGLINGLALGSLLAATAWLWKGNPYLGLVVGGALAVNTVVAVSIGGTVPLLLKRFGVDPAVASGPILTTITDMCGFFLVLSFASAMLSLLVSP